METQTVKKVELFTLKLTSDELDWLLFEVFPAAMRNSREPGFVEEAKFNKDQWWDELTKQGYKPF